MTKIEQSTIESIAGSTSHVSDRHKQLAALSYAKSRNIPQSEAFAIIFNKRLNWLNWLSIYAGDVSHDMIIKNKENK